MTHIFGQIFLIKPVKHTCEVPEDVGGRQGGSGHGILAIWSSIRKSIF